MYENDGNSKAHYSARRRNASLKSGCTMVAAEIFLSRSRVKFEPSLAPDVLRLMASRNPRVEFAYGSGKKLHTVEKRSVTASPALTDRFSTANMR
ncbi:MAG: hypothetical protein HY231_12805 [Acidobacteria bacterium]|nr:hypothetical protein [Acidobacteriota bacterium]